MNSKEKLESHKRLYSWIEEQAKKNKYFDEEDRISDWETLENLYPELLNLVEDYESLVEMLLKDIEKLEIDNIQLERLNSGKKR